MVCIPVIVPDDRLVLKIIFKKWGFDMYRQSPFFSVLINIPGYWGAAPVQFQFL